MGVPSQVPLVPTMGLLTSASCGASVEGVVGVGERLTTAVEAETRDASGSTPLVRFTRTTTNFSSASISTR